MAAFSSSVFSSISAAPLSLMRRSQRMSGTNSSGPKLRTELIVTASTSHVVTNCGTQMTQLLAPNRVNTSSRHTTCHSSLAKERFRCLWNAFPSAERAFHSCVLRRRRRFRRARRIFFNFHLFTKIDKGFSK